MRIICPKCGKEVQEIVLLSNPPQYQNICSCGWKGEVRNEAIYPYKEHRVVAN